MASSLEIGFAGHRFVLDANLALFWPDQKTLVVSDLHLEKSTFLAQHGSAVAPYDTLDTLTRLHKLVARYQPHTLLMLGDSFHDKGAWERLPHGARSSIVNICRSVESCVFVEGNHDLGIAVHPCLAFAAETNIGGVAFRHEPIVSDLPQIVGHFHPRTRMSVKGVRFTGKCFAMTDGLFIMPAFGSFTGGLDMSNDVYPELSGGQPWLTYLVYKSTVVSAKSA